MRLLSKTELKDRRSESALQLKEIDLYLSKKTKDLNAFKAEHEYKKKQILDEFIEFAENIAGKKATLDQDFATSEERKNKAFESLGVISVDADRKLKEVYEKNTELNRREKKVLADEDRLRFLYQKVTLDIKKADDRTALVDMQEARVEQTKKIIETEKQTLSSDRHKLELLYLEREKELDTRENDIKNISQSLEETSKSLKKEKEAFKDYISNEKTKIETERARDIRKIVETEYKKREADITTLRDNMVSDRLALSKDIQTVESEKKNLIIAQAQLSKGIDEFESEKTAKRQEFSEREAELQSKSTFLKIHADDVNTIAVANSEKERDIARRERSLVTDTDNASAKLNIRENELKVVADDLKNQYQKQKTKNDKREKSLDNRNSQLEEREAVIAKLEDTVHAKLSEIEEKNQKQEKQMENETLIITQRAELLDKRENDCANREGSILLREIALDEEKKQLHLRIKREERRQSEEKRQIADARATLDRAWGELRNKQS